MAWWLIAVNRLHDFVSICHLGHVVNGSDDTESESIKLRAPAYENYTFPSTPSGIEYNVTPDVAEEYESHDRSKESGTAIKPKLPLQICDNLRENNRVDTSEASGSDMHVTMALLISGHFPVGSFPDWIAHRAQLLDLSGWVKSHSTRLIEVQVTGNPVLIEALETACSLGPLDVLVDCIEVQHRQSLNSGSRFVVLN